MSYVFMSEEIYQLTQQDIPVGKRSSALAKLAHLCIEEDYLPEHCLQILIVADDRWGKFRDRKDRLQRLLGIVNYALAKTYSKNLVAEL